MVLMFIALWGMIASTRADYLWVAAHSALVFGLVFIFVIYILLSIAFGKYVGRFRLTCLRWLVAGCLTNPPLLLGCALTKQRGFGEFDSHLCVRVHPGGFGDSMHDGALFVDNLRRFVSSMLWLLAAHVARAGS